MTIQTQALKLNKKPTEEVARELLDGLYSTATTEQKYSLASLYKYFQPVDTKLPQDLVQWVDIAKSHDIDRPGLHRMYNDGERLLATDGHRLHVLKYDGELDKGYYDSQLNKIEHDGVYPDINKHIPKKEFQCIFKLDKTTLNEDFRIKAVLFGVTYIFNQQYIMDALNNQTICTVYVEEKIPTVPVLFEFTDYRFAVVMPCAP